MLGYWFLVIFCVLSWAGEKMPWLIVHIALPGTILAGIVVGRVIERGIVLAQERGLGWTDTAVFGGMIVAVVSWFLLAARLTYGNFGGDCAPTAGANSGCREVNNSDLNHWWVLMLPPLVWLGLLGFGALRRGWRNAALIGLSATIVVLGLLEMRVGWRLSYTNPDVPSEMMVYTQTAPDVKQSVEEANTLSRELAANGDGEILFDTGTDGLSWPLWWYFRDNSLAHSFGSLTLESKHRRCGHIHPDFTGQFAG